VRRVPLRVLLALALVTAAAARADEPEGPPVGDQELGARVGMSLDLAGVGPGGVHVAGVWLYRLADRVWFDGRAAFAIGGGGPDCVVPASGAARCDHALTDGFAAMALAGARWFPPASGSIVPWLGGGVGAGLADFPGDGVSGLALPVWGGGGARLPVADGVALAADALVDVAAVFYAKGVGPKARIGLTLAVGVDFRI
jgi:hypothetical protein